MATLLSNRKDILEYISSNNLNYKEIELAISFLINKIDEKRIEDVNNEYLQFELRNLKTEPLEVIKKVYNKVVQSKTKIENKSNSALFYLLNLTDNYNVKKRVVYHVKGSGPDIDTDFSPSQRESLFHQIQSKYGVDKVAKIGTITPHALKVSVVDFTKITPLKDKNGKILTDPNTDEPIYGTHTQGQELANKIPDSVRGRHTTWEVLKEDAFYAPLLRSNHDVFKHAGAVDGTPKNNGIHPCGILISPTPISNHIPIRWNKDLDNPHEGFFVTEWEGIYLEKDCNFIKYDLLAIDNLDLNAGVCKEIGKSLTWLEEQIDLNDPKVFELINSGNTGGLFQIEEPHVLQLINEIQPSTIEDIAIISAIIRPGPKDAGLTEDYIKFRKTNKLQNKLHPKLNKVLEETGGVLIYQEQVMAACQILAGVSLTVADDIRRAMGKKDKKLMDGYKKVFVDGCKTASNIENSEADRIWNAIEAFADYGFNKSHALAYAILTYQNAYLKAYHPSEFMAVLMTIRSTKPDKLKRYINETKRMGINIRPPDINKSKLTFTVDKSNNDITFGMAGIHGIGETVATKILEARGDVEFSSIWDFLARIDRSKINSKTIQILARCGALDCFNIERVYLVKLLAEILEYLSLQITYEETLERHNIRNQEIEEYNKAIEKWNLLSKEKLVEKLKDENGKTYWNPPKPKKPIAIKLRDLPIEPTIIYKDPTKKYEITKEYIQWEGQYCGFFISKHPLDFIKIPSKIEYNLLEDIDEAHQTTGNLVVAIVSKEEIKIKNGPNKGKLIANLRIEDYTGAADLVLYHSQYDLPEVKEAIAPGTIIYFPYKLISSINNMLSFRCTGKIKIIKYD